MGWPDPLSRAHVAAESAFTDMNPGNYNAQAAADNQEQVMVDKYQRDVDLSVVLNRQGQGAGPGTSQSAGNSISSPSAPAAASTPASVPAVSTPIWSGGAWVTPSTGDVSGDLTLPSNSPLIPAQAYNIAAVVQALANLQIVVTDSAGAQHKGSIQIMGNQAILSVKL